MKYQTVIGLEIHVELLTKTKLFCGCPTAFGGEPNTQCCPICIGMPGTLPVLNKKAVEFGVKAGLALNCEISNKSKMDRKNYFYPDLPKAFQVSQLYEPLCGRGYLDIKLTENSKRIGITRIHLEEDAGKLMHDRSGIGTLVDYNRGGTPLIEIVTEPDMSSPDEAKAFLETLKSILEYIEVSDCKMQEGSLRCDVNISLKPAGKKELGKRVEIKNMNSFKSAYKAMEFEIIRQTELIEKGEIVKQETRRWDDVIEQTFSMRSKEEAHDYKYFPEPDLLPIIIDKDWLENLRSEIPELPGNKKLRYTNEFQLSDYDAEVLISSKSISDLFDKVVKEYGNPKIVANWIMGDYLKLKNENSNNYDEDRISAVSFAKLLQLIEAGVVNTSIAKMIFEEMFKTGAEPDAIIMQKGLTQISDFSEVEKIVDEVLIQYPRSIEDYKNGKKQALGFLVGQAMRLSRGKANPQILNEILIKRLD